MACEDRKKGILVKTKKHNHNNHNKTKVSGLYVSDNIQRIVIFPVDSGSSLYANTESFILLLSHLPWDMTDTTF